MEDFQHIHLAYQHSNKLLERARGFLHSEKTSIEEYITVMAVGSYGRMEANSTTSDFEWIVIYDDSRVTKHEAEILQAKIAEGFARIFTREKLSIGKTFNQICTLSQLNSDIGGFDDNNQMLTYRMLVMAEGSPIYTGNFYNRVIDALANTYGASHTAGHRLLSLATDFSRYWKTLRIDFKNKVDERQKTWPIRSIKLRSVRRFWFFSVITYFLAFGPRIDSNEENFFPKEKIVAFLKEMYGSPALRLTKSHKVLNGDSKCFEEILSLYDNIISYLGNGTTRNELDEIRFEDRHANEIFINLTNKCRRLHVCMGRYILSLPEFYKNEAIEMFLI